MEEIAKKCKIIFEQPLSFYYGKSKLSMLAFCYRCVNNTSNNHVMKELFKFQYHKRPNSLSTDALLEEKELKMSTQMTQFLKTCFLSQSTSSSFIASLTL